MTILDEILATTREDVARRRASRAGGVARPPRRPAPPGAFRDALAATGLSIIAEHKRSSPSAGAIRPGSSVAEIARAYERGGAAAMSVLTEERHFDGSLEDLREARRACGLPLLRKDFIVDSYQLAEAASAGAAAVLLIVAALEPPRLRALHDEAAARRLDVLVEVHDAAELEAALDAGACIVGINNRDLRDFSVELERTFSLRDAVPDGVLVVSESGISTPEQLARLCRHRVDGALVGERLMREDDPGGGAALRARRCARAAGVGSGAVIVVVGVDAARVKICGITRLADALLAAELGAWAVGMVFYPGSSRRCTIAEAEAIGAALRRRVELAGVFVNAPLDEIARVSERVGLTLVQLHGDEGPAFCAEVARRTGARTIKAVAVRGIFSLRDLERFHTSFHLLDGHAPGQRGGTGEPFDWTLVSTRRSRVPLIVGGGLDPTNVREAIAATHPFAVDVASGVESAPGIKDPERLRAFLDEVRAVAG